MPPSTVQNIVIRFRESAGVSVCRVQRQKPKLDARDPRALGHHCITNRPDSLLDITDAASPV